MLALHGCTESYAGQAIGALVRSVDAYCWSSIGHGPGSPICARQLSMARQWVLTVLQCMVHCPWNKSLLNPIPTPFILDRLHPLSQNPIHFDLTNNYASLVNFFFWWTGQLIIFYKGIFGQPLMNWKMFEEVWMLWKCARLWKNSIFNICLVIIDNFYNFVWIL